MSCLRYLQYSPHPAKRPPRRHGLSLIEEGYATEVTDQASGTYTYEPRREVTVEIYDGILDDGGWTDLSDENISELLDIDFIPNNACINALFL